MITKNQCEVTVDCLPESVPIHGNCSAINDKQDARTEKWIRHQLYNGNCWAWCCIKVTVTYVEVTGQGMQEYSECEYIGCCSYRSGEDFVVNSGYFADLVDECVERLNLNLTE